MTRLIHLADYRHPRTGSFVPALHAVLSAAVERGWRAEAVFISGPEPLPWLQRFHDSGIPTRFIDSTGHRERAAAIGSMLDEHPDEQTIVHTHFTTFDIAAALAVRGRPGAKAIWHEHTALTGSPRIVARNVVKFGLAGRGVEMILCPAPDLARAVRRRLAPRSRVVFLPNAIDASRFEPTSSQQRAQIRGGLDIPAGAPVLLNFAWHWELKGGDIFAAALQRVRATRPDAIGILISERAKVEQLGAGMEAGLRVLAPRSDVRSLYAAADIFVAPSRAEGGTPYAVLEAVASELPVVASAIPGHTFICDGLASCRTAAAEPDAIATAIESLLAAPPTPEALRAGRARIVSDFDLSIWSGRLIDIYLGLLA
jgi:glycosyltransferase involved in cell wall biosynthesis